MKIIINKIKKLLPAFLVSLICVSIFLLIIKRYYLAEVTGNLVFVFFWVIILDKVWNFIK